ncbi:GLABROUS1 enhancer-binding protein family [Dillenia turbinata]|uniref:GLABROUS1 enhancer-binding protein family n=1 Tax=Dillenia turbinata TaxID=194707 RepID=A0AAN8UDM7_9MAGN
MSIWQEMNRDLPGVDVVWIRDFLYWLSFDVLGSWIGYGFLFRWICLDYFYVRTCPPLSCYFIFCSSEGHSWVRTEEDETMVLQGVIVFMTNRGKDPTFDLFEFFAFVRRSIQFDGMHSQVKSKLRRLKDKVFSNFKDGRISRLQKLKTRKFITCQKNIWGEDDVVEEEEGMNEVSSGFEFHSGRGL